MHSNSKQRSNKKEKENVAKSRSKSKGKNEEDTPLNVVKRAKNAYLYFSTDPAIRENTQIMERLKGRILPRNSEKFGVP